MTPEGGEVGKSSRVLSAGAVWLGIFVVYCLAQTIANALSKETQDWLLWGLPVAACVAAATAVYTGPPLRLVPRLLVAGGAALAFGALYSVYFNAIIVGSLNLWRGEDWMLQPLQGVVGALVLVGVVSGTVAGGLAGGDYQSE